MNRRNRTPRGSASWVAIAKSTMGGLLIAAAGCGQGPAKPDHIPALTPTTVTVTYNGQPVADASVLLAPESGSFSAAGITDATGKAVMKTDGMYDGVATGDYQGTVTKKEKLVLDIGPTPEDPAEYAAYEAKLKAQPAPKHLVPERYSSFATSSLSASITDGTPTEITFALED